MTDSIENEGMDELDFDISKVVADPKPGLPKMEVDGNEEMPEPAKRPGRPKKAELVDDTPITPIPAKTPETEEPVEAPEETSIEETETGLIQTLSEKLGIALDEDEMYEETEDGLVNYVQSVSDKLADARLNEWLDKLPPIASEFFDYLQMQGEEATEDNIKKFFTAVNPEIDYKSIDLNNEDVQKAVVKTMYKKMGYDDNEIKEAIEDQEIAGTLAKTAKIASNKLAATQETERAALMEEQRIKDAAKRESIQKYWNNIDNTIKGGKVHNFNIPVTEQKALLDYMAKPGKSGVPQLQEDLNNMSQEDRIALAIAVKNKFNLSKYITTAAKTVQANTLRDKLKGVTPKLKGGMGNNADISNEIEFKIK